LAILYEKESKINSYYLLDGLSYNPQRSDDHPFISGGLLRMDRADESRPLEGEESSDGTIIAEIQLLLAEKRTSLAVLRTGITMAILPLSVMSLLVATSRYYEIEKVWHILVPLLLISLALLIVAGYLISRSIVKFMREDRLIMEIKKKHSRIAEFID
jgi:uncharacterized membrane protein YidH (DUF202 family)